MKPRIEAFYDTVTATVTYVVYDEPGGRAAVVDPVLDYDPKSGRTRTGSAGKVLDSCLRCRSTFAPATSRLPRRTA